VQYGTTNTLAAIYPPELLMILLTSVAALVGRPAYLALLLQPLDSYAHTHMVAVHQTQRGACAWRCIILLPSTTNALQGDDISIFILQNRPTNIRNNVVVQSLPAPAPCHLLRLALRLRHTPRVNNNQHVNLHGQCVDKTLFRRLRR
jgi:hypothetical protein